MADNDLVVEIAPGADPAAPGTWSWVDISEYLQGEINIDRGRADEDSRPTPSRMTLRLDNADGRFSRLNPSSPYFPRLRLNTPIRVSLRRASDAFGRTVVDGWGEADTGQAWVIDDIDLDPGNFAVASGSASMVTSGAGPTASRPLALAAGLVVADIEATATLHVQEVALGNGYAAGIAVLADGRDDMVICRARFDPGGTLGIDIRAIIDGVDAPLGAAVPAGYTYGPGDRIRIRCATVGRQVRATAWPATAPEPPGWQVEAEIPEALPRRGEVGLTGWRFGTNLNGDLAFAFEAFEARSVRYTGYVSEWPLHPGLPEESRADITASGALRRLQLGEDTSNAWRTITALGPHAYWPMEDPSGSETIASACIGQPTGAIVAQSERGGPVRLASAGPDGSAPVPRFEPGESVQFPAVGDMVGDWTVAFAFRAVPADEVRDTFGLNLLRIWGGHASAGLWWGAAGTETAVGGAHRIGYTWDDAFTPDLDAWHTIVWQITTPELGDWECALIVDGVPLASGTVQQAPPQLGRLKHFWLPEAEDNPAGGEGDVDLHVGHLAIWEGHPDIAVDYHRAVIEGHAGETAEARLARLADTGQVRVAIATPTHPEATDIMGPQQVGTIADTIDACEETNRGQAYEDLSGDLSIVTRADLYTQASPNAEAFIADGHLGIRPGMEIQDDDQRIVNAATARNWDGTTKRVADQDSIDQIGLYARRIDVNTIPDADHLRSYAGWEVARSRAAKDIERYPEVPLNIDTDYDLAGEWLSGDPLGKALHLTSVENVSPGPIRQVIEGYTETWSKTFAAAAAYCSPLAAWEVAQVGDPATGRIDTAGSRIGGTGSLVDIVGAADSDPWDGTSGSDPAVAPSVDAPGPGVLVCAWTSWSEDAGYVPPSSMTVVAQATGEWASHAVATEPIAAAGPTGPREATLGSDDAWSAVALAVAIAGSVTVVSAHTAYAHWTDPPPQITTAPAEAGWWMVAIGAADEDGTGLLGPPSGGGWEQVTGTPPASDASRTVAWARQVTAPGPQTVAIADAGVDHFLTVLVLDAHADEGGVDPADTTITVTSDHAPWTTDPADLPLSITVGPETMTVTAVTGTGPTQSMTVERGTPALAHDPGAPVRLARTPRAGL